MCTSLLNSKSKKGLPFRTALSLIGRLAVDCKDSGSKAKQDARAECYSHMGVKETVFSCVAAWLTERLTRMVRLVRDTRDGLLLLV